MKGHTLDLRDWDSCITVAADNPRATHAWNYFARAWEPIGGSPAEYREREKRNLREFHRLDVYGPRGILQQKSPVREEA